MVEIISLSNERELQYWGNLLGIALIRAKPVFQLLKKGISLSLYVPHAFAKSMSMITGVTPAPPKSKGFLRQ